jgi:hypothetical protein
MSSQKKKKLPSENTTGILRIDVEPRNRSNKHEFSRFKEWLYKILGTEADAERAAKEYIDAAFVDKLEKLKQSSIKNESMEREIEFRMQQKELNEEEMRRKALFAPVELELVEEQRNKLRAEKEAIEAETHLKVMEKLKELGVEALPIVKNGKLTGLYISKDDDLK